MQCPSVLLGTGAGHQILSRRRDQSQTKITQPTATSGSRPGSLSTSCMVCPVEKVSCRPTTGTPEHLRGRHQENAPPALHQGACCYRGIVWALTTQLGGGGERMLGDPVVVPVKWIMTTLDAIHVINAILESHSLMAPATLYRCRNEGQQTVRAQRG